MQLRAEAKDQRVISFLKGLVLDGVGKAASGHTGGAFSSMDFAYLLFTEGLEFDPDDPKWLGRDRFVLSAGHESMLLYGLLRAVGWLETEDLRGFRQLHSRTPGHPENALTPGVECTTGPLGQGAAMSVGLAAGSKHFQGILDSGLFAGRVWALLGDGCMQEDITLGAASLAGHWGLGNLVWFYDRNGKQISGDIERVTSDDYGQIFRGFGWRVLEIDGHDHEALRRALAEAKRPLDQPLLIIGTTVMANGAATVEGDHETHGAPFSKEETNKTKSKLGLNPEEVFAWPSDVSHHFQRNFEELRAKVKNWKASFARLSSSREWAEKWQTYFGSPIKTALSPISWDESKPIATRVAFGKLLETWCGEVPGLVGGSADLEPSNMTGAFAKKVGEFCKANFTGRNISFGVREFPMVAIANGLALHGGLTPFTATFLSFADYSRAAIRLGAIQKVRVIHELTHDSFYLGEDGPTHQPVEHVMSLRVIPDLYVFRPADPKETEALLEFALKADRPSCFALTRQNVPYLHQSRETVYQKAVRGAWVVRGEEEATPEMAIFATGSEVGLAIQVAQLIESKGLASQDSVRVVSVPSWELFAAQDEAYQAMVLQEVCTKRVSMEAGVTLGWERFVGRKGVRIGIDQYGASGKPVDLEREFGFTAEQCVERIMNDLYFSTRGF